ncbi:hypothetical protein N9X61_01165 [Sulfurimonas sp.]|nr:hypothetical protein [Sulfurimonas sp.]
MSFMQDIKDPRNTGIRYLVISYLTFGWLFTALPIAFIFGGAFLLIYLVIHFIVAVAYFIYQSRNPKDTSMILLSIVLGMIPAVGWGVLSGARGDEVDLIAMAIWAGSSFGVYTLMDAQLKEGK